MYFESKKHGGGKIYGDIIYQKDQGKAVISFCHPRGKIYRILILCMVRSRSRISNNSYKEILIKKMF